MNYIIRLDCIAHNNPYNLKYNEQVWIKDVFGNEKKHTKSKDDAYRFMSLERAKSIAYKIMSNHIFKPVIIKTI